MDIKNAAAVCLISLVSATLVVLIARALDLQAASRLEPQLTRIAEELQAIRRQGRNPQEVQAAAARGTSGDRPVKDGVIVYYFHGTYRCSTCRTIESLAHETVLDYFSAELDKGVVVWKVLNYELPSSADLAKEFDLVAPVVVLARIEAGRTAGWKRLDEVWNLVDDEPAYREFVRGEIDRLLAAGDAESNSGPEDATAETGQDEAGLAASADLSVRE